MNRSSESLTSLPGAYSPVIRFSVSPRASPSSRLASPRCRVLRLNWSWSAACSSVMTAWNGMQRLALRISGGRGVPAALARAA